MEDLFKSVENKNDQESYEVFLSDEDKRQEFYEYLSLYARALKLALSSDKIDDIFSESDIDNYKSKMKFYSELRVSIRIRYHEKIDFGKYEKQMQKLLDTFISADEVIQLTKLVNIFDESFEDEIQRVVGDNARADAILSATTSAISEKMESNPAYYGKLSLRIKEIIEEYKDKRLTEEEKLKQAKDIRDMMMTQDDCEEDNYPISIQKNRFACAIYDNISDEFNKLFADLSEDIIINFSVKTDEIFKDFLKKPDWQNNIDYKNKIDNSIATMLWALEDEYEKVFEDSEDLIARIRNIGINNYS